MVNRIFTPILNSLMFFLFIYLAHAYYGIDKLIPYLILSVLVTITLIILGLAKKLGRTYVFVSALPLIISLTVAFLLFTGIGWWVLMIFGFNGPTPN